MSYYVDFEGEISFKEKLNKNACENITAILKDFTSCDNCKVRETKKETVISFYGYEVYYDEDSFIEGLREISEYYEINSSNIEFVGEGSEFWKFSYNNGEWYEQSGSIVYDGSRYPI